MLLKDSIESLNLFSNFEDNVKKNISERINEYSITEYNLEKNKNKYENYDLMVERLEELKKLSLDYYTQSQNIYDVMKDQLINNVAKINELITTCEKVTYEIIKNKYKEIKDNFNKIEESKNSEEK